MKGFLAQQRNKHIDGDYIVLQTMLPDSTDRDYIGASVDDSAIAYETLSVLWDQSEPNGRGWCTVMIQVSEDQLDVVPLGLEHSWWVSASLCHKSQRRSEILGLS